MIVNCPKCGFEQPIDEYCAQCGAPLRKLVELQKQQKQNSSNPPLFLTAFAFCIVAGVAIFLGVKGGEEEGSISFSNEVEESSDSNVVVSLKSAKIKADKKAKRPKIVTKSSSEYAALEKYPKLKNQSARPIKAEKSIEQPTAVATQDTQAAEPIAFKTLKLISSQNCDTPLSDGALSASDLSALNSCAQVFSSQSFNGSGEIEDQGESFATFLTWEVSNSDLKINISFNSEEFESSQSESMNLSTDANTKAYVFSNPFSGLIDKDSLKEDAANSLFNSKVFEFSEDDVDIFILLSE